MATNNSVDNVGVTQTAGTNNTTLATTAFVQTAVSGSGLTANKAVALAYLLGR
jgi:hypothetical protein